MAVKKAAVVKESPSKYKTRKVDRRLLDQRKLEGYIPIDEDFRSTADTILCKKKI